MQDCEYFCQYSYSGNGLSSDPTRWRTLYWTHLSTRSRFPTNPPIKPISIPSWQLEDKSAAAQAEKSSNGDAEKSSNGDAEKSSNGEAEKSRNLEKSEPTAPDIVAWTCHIKDEPGAQ